MKSILTIALTLVALSLSAAELPIPEEQAALAAMAEGLFAKPPEWSTTKGAKTLVWSKDQLLIRVTLDPKTGHVTGYYSNGIPVTNDRLTKLAACKELTSVAFDHSGQWHYKEIPMSAFSGSGWEALVSSKIEEVRIGGSHMGPPGELALAKMGSLRRLTYNHVPMTKEGIAQLCTHPALVSFTVGAQHNTMKSFSWYEAVPRIAAIPTLRELGINELYLSWDNALAKVAENGSHLKKLVFGRGAVLFPEDAKKVRAALPGLELVIEPYARALHGNKLYAARLKTLMTAEEFARLEALASSEKTQPR